MNLMDHEEGSEVNVAENNLRTSLQQAGLKYERLTEVIECINTLIETKIKSAFRRACE